MTQFSSRLGAVALALVVTIATFGIVLPVGAQTADATEIDSCTTIDEAGMYVLTADIENSDAETCIEIRTSDVTLDGAGHTIDGVDDGSERPTGTIGVLVTDGSEAVTIRELTISEWGSSGIEYDNATGTVTDVRAASSYSGIVFDETVGGTVTESTAVDNEAAGIAFVDSGRGTVSDVTATGNGAGVYFQGSFGTVQDTRATNNDLGISLFEANARVTDTAVNDNEIGVDLLDSGIGLTDIDATGSDVAYNGLGFVEAENLTLDSATLSFTGEGHTVIAPVEDAPADPDGLANVGEYVNVAGDDRTELSLGVWYDEAAVEGASVEESTLRLYEYDGGEWSELSDSTVDTDANVVSGTADDFTGDLFTPDPEAYRIVAPLGQTDGDETDDGDGSDDGDSTDGGATDGSGGVDDRDETDGDGTDSDDGDAGDSDDDAGGDKSDDKKDEKNGESDDKKSDDDDVVDVGTKDLVIDLGDVTIANFDLRGPRLADEHVDHRTYSVGGFDVEIDGLSLTLGDTDYRIGHVTITVEPFDVILEDVTLGDGE